MKEALPLPILTALLRIQRRADTVDPRVLVETFVEVGPILALLSSPDHQIVYGRRGTGKTHALQYLAETVTQSGDLAIYLDMRTIGSTGGLHYDPDIPLGDRCTRLLVDILGVIHETLLTYAFEAGEDNTTWARWLDLLDSFSLALSDVKVVGTTTQESQLQQATQAQRKEGLSVRLGATPELGFSTDVVQRSGTAAHARLVESGVARHRVHFGEVHSILLKLLDALPCSRVWIVLDEWSDVPLDLQPLLADFVKRCLLPIRKVTVKFGAIEHRSVFQVRLDGGGYLGIEVGADVSADLDLDDFLLFDNDRERAKTFYRDLLYRHVRAIEAPDHDREGSSEANEMFPADAQAFARALFSTDNALDELAIAAEGVPRDAINICIFAAQAAPSERLSVGGLRNAAAHWYERDKERATTTDEEVAFLAQIVNAVTQAKKARAFLIAREEASNPFMRQLYDARLIHLVRRGVSHSHFPRKRFDIFSLDYGCYVQHVREIRGGPDAGGRTDLRPSRLPILQIKTPNVGAQLEVTTLVAQKKSAASAAAVGIDGETDTAHTQLVYTMTTEYFDMQYPRGWRTGKVRLRAGLVEGTLRYSANSDVVVRIEIVPTSVQHGEASDPVEGLRRREGFRELRRETTRLAGYDAIFAECVYPYKASMMQRIAWSFTDGVGRGFTVFGEAPEVIFPRMRGVLSTTCESISVHDVAVGG